MGVAPLAPDPWNPWKQVETIVQSTLGEDDLFDREICLKILEDVGGLSDARAVLEAYGQEPKIRIRDLLRFINAPACGLYNKTLSGIWPGIVDVDGSLVSQLPENHYLIVTAKGNTYHLKCLPDKGELNVSPNLDSINWNRRGWKAMDKPVKIDGWFVRQKDIAPLIGPEEIERAMKPRDFSPCLVGTYGPKQLPKKPGSPYDHPWVPMSEECTIQKNGSVQYRPSYVKSLAYCHLTGKMKEYEYGRPEKMTTSQVKCVRRSDQWPLVLHPGPGAHIEAQYPPLCFIELEDGKTIDLAKAGFTAGSALLSSTRISYHGLIKDAEGVECIVSFPGRYPEGWLECVEGSHDMSVACVFLCDKDDGLGDHAPEDDCQKCYCKDIYGLCPPRAVPGETTDCRNFEGFGYKDKAKTPEENKEECDRNGGRPKWGCAWFQKWRKNVETAVSRKQKLIVYFFPGQVAQGRVKWEDLPTAQLWDGIGLGGSQKGEVAYLDKMGYPYEMRDVSKFLGEYASHSVRIF